MVHNKQILKPILFILLFCHISPLFAQTNPAKKTDLNQNTSQEAAISSPNDKNLSPNQIVDEVSEPKTEDTNNLEEIDNIEIPEKQNLRAHFATIGIGIGGTYPSYGVLEKESSNPTISLYAGYLYRQDVFIAEAGLRTDLDSRMAYGDISLNGYLGGGYIFHFPGGDLPVEGILELGSPALSAKEMATSFVIRLVICPSLFLYLFF